MLGAGTAVAAAERTGLRDIAASIRRTFPDHVPLYVCTALFCAVTAAVIVVFRLPVPMDAATFFFEIIGKFLILGAGLAAMVQLIALIREDSAERPLPMIARRLRERILAGDRAGNMFHALVTLTPLMVCFASMKSVIPDIKPFSWDRTFMDWDRAIGFGHLPWQLLQPELGYPVVTAALNATYDAWFLIMFGSLFWQAFSCRRSRTRMQYLLAFAFSWFLAGNVMAAVFSSAGPCFYGHLHPGHDPYAAQMAYLHMVGQHWPMWSLQVQDLLWQSYATGSGVVSGISAMPSMHVTSTVLIALLCWRIDRRLGALLWLFAGLIVIGSIHLAWHYAVDSLAGIALAVIFWQAAGLILRADARYRARRDGAPRAGRETAAA